MIYYVIFRLTLEEKKLHVSVVFACMYMYQSEVIRKNTTYLRHYKFS